MSLANASDAVLDISSARFLEISTSPQFSEYILKNRILVLTLAAHILKQWNFKFKLLLFFLLCCAA